MIPMSDIKVSGFGGSDGGNGREWIEPNFENFRTIAFDRDYMRKLIGTGDPIFDGSEFKGFDPKGTRRTWPTPHTALCLEVRVWLGFVPECYRAEVERGIVEIQPRFLNQKIEPGNRTVDRFVEELWRWIGFNVEPVR